MYLEDYKGWATKKDLSRNCVGFKILLRFVDKSSLKMLCLILENECFKTFQCSLPTQGDLFQMILA